MALEAVSGAMHVLGCQRLVDSGDTMQSSIKEAFDSLIENGIRLMDGRHRTLCVSRHLPACFIQHDSEWSLGQFELLDEVYRGKTSLLHKAIHKASGQCVAIKQYRKKYLSPLNRYQVEREIQIHINLLHHHIIRLHAAFEDPEHVYLVQEFAPGGDLFEALKQQPSMTFTEPEAVARFMEPCLEAMAYMQDRGIIHRDIKPENILLGEGGDIKLADFGLAINCEQERPVTRAGTLDYMAPEVLVCPDKKLPDQNKDIASLGYDRQVDAWALGCLAAELVTGSPPFEADSRSATYQLIMYRQPRLPAYLSQAAISFIAGSLVKAPSERSTVYQLLQHEWITSNKVAPTDPVNVAAATDSLTCSDTMSVGSVDPSSTVSTDQHHASNRKSSPNSTHAGADEAEQMLAHDSSDGQAAMHVDDSITHCCHHAEQFTASEDTHTASPSVGMCVSPAPAAICSISGVISAAAAAAATTSSSCTTPISGSAASEVVWQDVNQHAAAADSHASDLAQSTSDSTHAAEAAATSGMAQAYKRQQWSSACITGVADGDCATAMAVDEVTAPAASGLTAADSLAADDLGTKAGAASGTAQHSHTECTVSSAARQLRNRPSSGHHLHKLFYPHDKHRRSSYSNMPWDDFIDTSSHSFTSSTNFAATALNSTDSSFTAAGDGTTFLAAVRSSIADKHTSGDGQPVTCCHASTVVSGSASAAAAGEPGRPLAVSTANSSSASSSSPGLGQLASRQSALLAALTDADVQAPAAVMSEVLAKTASGALHLLAANDLEDLIAPTVTPSTALSTLGLAVPAAADLVVISGSVNLKSCASGRVSAAVAHGGDQSTAAAAANSIMNGYNLDDFIAPSAAPSGHIHRSFIVPGRNRSSSVPSLLALVAPSPASPSASPVRRAAAASSGTSAAPMTSPCSSRVHHTSCIGLGPAGYQHGSARQPQAAICSRKTSASIGADDTAVISGGDAEVCSPVRHVKSGILLSLVAQEQDGYGSCSPTHSRSTPTDGLSSAVSTPSGSKRVVWADETPMASPRSETVQTLQQATVAGCTRQGPTASPAYCTHQSHIGVSGRDGACELLQPLHSAVTQMLQPHAPVQQQSAQYYVPPAGALSYEPALGNITGLYLRQSTNRQAAQIKCLDSTAETHATSTPIIVGTLQQQAVGFIANRGRRRLSSSEDRLLPAACVLHDKQRSIGCCGRDGPATTARHISMHGELVNGEPGILGSEHEPHVPPYAPSGVMGLSNSCLWPTAKATSMVAVSGKLCEGAPAGDLLTVRRDSKSFTAGMSGYGPAAGGRRTGALTPTKTVTHPSDTVGTFSTKTGLVRSKSVADVTYLARRQ